MTLYNPFMKFLNPRNSGLITFKGGGGASAMIMAKSKGVYPAPKVLLSTILFKEFLEYILN